MKKDPALAKLSAEIAIASKDLKEKNRTYEAAVSALAIAENDEEKNLVEIERLKGLTAIQAPELENLFILISRRATEPITNIEGLDGRKASLHETYSNEIAVQHSTADTSATAAVMKMEDIILHPDWGHQREPAQEALPAAFQALLRYFQHVRLPKYFLVKRQQHAGMPLVQQGQCRGILKLKKHKQLSKRQ